METSDRVPRLEGLSERSIRKYVDELVSAFGHVSKLDMLLIHQVASGEKHYARTFAYIRATPGGSAVDRMVF